LDQKQLIDAVTAGHPVFVSRLDGHMGLANSQALHLAGITRDTPDPPGGTIVRDASGEPTGVLKDAAMDRMDRAIPAPSTDQIAEAVRAAMRYAAENGVSSVQDMSAAPEILRVYQTLLARGELRLIGASAPDEYRQYVEKDAALERQFQPVYVEPPSARATVDILRGLRERHEAYHGVRICDSAIEAAVALSDRYVSGRYLPDKAVDLIDEAASRLRIGIESAPDHLDQITHTARRVEIQLIALDRSGSGPASQRSQLEQDLAALRAQAKEMTAQWRAEQEAVSSIRRIRYRDMVSASPSRRTRTCTDWACLAR